MNGIAGRDGWPAGPAHPAALAEEVHVWRVSLGSPAARSLEEALAPEERRRSEMLAPESRRRFVAARGALRAILGSYRRCEPGRLGIVYGPQGKPCLDASGPSFNLSHSGEVALCAVTGGAAVGVDVEKVRLRPRWRLLAERFFPDEERAALDATPEAERPEAFLRVWTRHEARLKARGEGLAGLGALREAAAACSVLDLAPAPGYVGSVAVEGGAPLVRCWDWPAPASVRPDASGAGPAAR